MFSFKPTFSLSSYIFNKRLFSSSSLSAIRVVSSEYPRLLIFLPTSLIPVCASSSLEFCMMYSAYKLNKQGDNIQLWCIGLPWWLRQQRICLQRGRPRFNPWFRKILWRSKWQPTPVFLPGKSQGWRGLAGYSPWGCKELETTEPLQFPNFEPVCCFMSSSNCCFLICITGFSGGR